MWWRNTLVFTFTILLCALALEPTTGVAQQKSLKEQLTGIWTFVSALETSKDGKTSDRWGANPKGMIILDASGRYSFMISRSDIPKFAARRPRKTRPLCVGSSPILELGLLTKRQRL